MPAIRSGCSRLTLTLLTTLFVVSGQVAAETATFDDLETAPGEFAVPSLEAYRALRWSGIEVVNVTHEVLRVHPNSGYRTGVVSGAHVAVVASRHGAIGTIASSPWTTFDFQEVHLTAAWRDGLNVLFEGLRRGTLLHSETVVVDTKGPTRASFDFYGIDTLRIRTSGGVDAGLCKDGCQPGPEVVLDDFSFLFPSAPAPMGSPPAAEPIESPPAAEAPSVALTEKPPTTPDGSAPAVTKAKSETPSPSPPPAPTDSGCTEDSRQGVQVGAFSQRANALGIRQRLAGQGHTVYLYGRDQNGKEVIRVVVGCLETTDAAADLQGRLNSAGVSGFVVRHDRSRLGQPR